MSPFPTNSLDSDLVKAMTVAVPAELGPIFGLPSLPAIDATLTIRPYLRSIIFGSTTLQHNTKPITFMLKTNSQSGRSSSQIGRSRPLRLATPALFTRLDVGPSFV